MAFILLRKFKKMGRFLGTTVFENGVYDVLICHAPQNLTSQKGVRDITTWLISTCCANTTVPRYPFPVRSREATRPSAPLAPTQMSLCGNDANLTPVKSCNSTLCSIDPRGGTHHGLELDDKDRHILPFFPGELGTPSKFRSVKKI